MKLLQNHIKFKAVPATYKEILKNQEIRASSVFELKTKEVSAETGKATQKFWSTQAGFFVWQLHRKQEELCKIFPDIITSKMPLSKKNLNNILATILKALDENSLSEDEQRALLAVFVPDKETVFEKKHREKTSKDEDTQEQTELKKTLPHIFIQSGDSIEFAYQQAMHKFILIMDAANSQRPGAGAYEKGTYQEALTRHTDLYWRVIDDFYDVLQKLIEQKKSIVVPEEGDKEIKKINVLSYQMRFLQLILFFVKKAIEDDSYFLTTYFRKVFFTYAKSIYGDMQNNVLELPFDSGFIKDARICELKSIEKTSDLFINDVFSSAILESKLPHLLIGEVAAPDKRMAEGRYDRACTFNLDLRESNQDAKAEEMITNAITYILHQAKQRDVDIIILNAFGCGAFKNSPQTVASIFAEALAKHQKDLYGKSIYFMDMAQDKCMTFGAVFSQKLQNKFNINCYPQGKNVLLNVLIAELTVETIPKTEAIIAAHNSRVIKQRFDFFKEQPTHVIEFKGLESKPKTKETLKKAYSATISTAMKAGKTTLHMPLLGTGKLKFAVTDSIAALQESLQEIAATQKIDTSMLQIILYIPPKEAAHYHTVTDYLRQTKASVATTLSYQPA